MRWSGRLVFLALAAGLVLAAGALPAGSIAFAAPDAGPASGETHSAGGDAGANATAGGRYQDPRDRPAEDGAYYYRQMILALVVMAGMIALLAWLVRRQTRKR